ncbi:holo-ACP synthase [Polynucleobacter sp. UK-Gri1-W3]|uniref:holo-ACP synthase n=1 Tax=Polynucleobacter sp. UK-Gri1-W3 TaxID=1819737 RepID=UPI001C0B1B4F|nr:4'-phosphopantetheinyl transferase superfamily protein [Polynucleobacter sp. UK-Gri1-W3]MBU3538245.1 4'-phosphopantetheinyl transferase superfamily protein [Polynucleobacter sp. UK-Gri1-W3]
MSVQITLEYLSKLLNKPITDRVEIALSSAQKSRVHGWLSQNGILFNESTLAGKFYINQLLGGAGVSVEQLQISSKEIAAASSKLDMGKFQIGIDIQRVDELFPKGLSFDPKVDKGLTQIYTTKELSYAQSKTDPIATLTGIFCAKEAIQKASNLNKKLMDIEILPDLNGMPRSEGFLVSISHSGDYAVAIAVVVSPDSIALKNISENEGDTIMEIKKTRGLFEKINNKFIYLISFFLLILYVIHYKF